MYKGIYIALSGAVLKQKSLENISQNIANADTSGYKKGRLSFKDHMIAADNMPTPSGDGRVMADLSTSSVDFSNGTISRTGNPLDLAINGKGFFALENGKYTRNGNFMVDSEGNLVTAGGVKVLGDGGPITVEGSSVDILSSGEIVIDEIPVGTLKIVDFPDKSSLKKLSGGMFATEETGETIDAQVSQGYLEESNVNVIQEMIHMISTQREFESYQKMIHAFDEATSKTINEMGK
jgi:flagellar basal-body rod protein FlgG